MKDHVPFTCYVYFFFFARREDFSLWGFHFCVFLVYVTVSYMLLLRPERDLLFNT